MVFLEYVSKRLVLVVRGGNAFEDELADLKDQEPLDSFETQDSLAAMRGQEPLIRAACESE